MYPLYSQSPFCPLPSLHSLISSNLLSVSLALVILGIPYSLSSFVWLPSLSTMLYICVLQILIYLKDKATERESSSIAGWLPNSCNGQDWARLKPGPWNSTWVSDLCGWHRSTPGSILCSFPRYISWEMNWKWSIQDWNGISIWDACTAGSSLSHCTTALSLAQCFWRSLKI